MSKINRFDEFFMENGTYKFRSRPSIEYFVEREKLISNIALMKLLIEGGKKGDMERLIKEFSLKLLNLKQI